MTEPATRALRRTIPITLFLVLGFGGLTTLAVAFQVVLVFESSRANTLELLRDKTAIAVDGIEARVHALLGPVAAQGQAITRLAQEGSVLAGPRIEPFLIGTLTATPQVETLSVIVPGVARRDIRRTADGFESTRRAPTAEDQRRVSRASQTGDAFWDEPRMSDGEVVLEHVTVLRDAAGGMRAVFVQRVSGARLSRAITTASAGAYQPTPFVLQDDDAVLAHPLLIGGGLQLPAAARRLPTIGEIGDGVLARLHEPDELGPFSVATAPGDTVKGISFGEHVYLFAFRTVPGYGQRPWRIGAYVNGSGTRVQVRRLVRGGLVGLAALLLVATVALLVGRAASRPAKRLARAAQQVRQGEGELDRVEPVPPSWLRELDEAGASFNEMVAGLRERRVIRDLFGKFVPERVAAAMLHSPEGLAPQSCEASILFVDLAGFTTLAESVGPAMIVEILNAYFSELVAIIEAHEGIVTQFQGDAILAVFNVPQPVPEHARRATEAAREILAAVAGGTFAGHRLRCRIGISTGTVVAGNVGATGRMNYTVHGDAVNLAARLEQLNKEHGTDILLAGDTVARVGDGAFRRIGTVEVRGRSAPVTLYTLSAPGEAAGAAPPAVPPAG